ncbi:hypothetical protein GJW-30_1_00938 [Variibacter gotjawalensis]|uniref:IrrE N-terminal-like domain-containing protein n=1 Tax=Variibacter gotjawalensis TaxID=1333996 RepID=A0A0S3PRA6_9BRAD|nr:ImmA/IrrE family metallo-endopeptidase [Variibacter gotjawalensis]NIK48718.1 hypothetical protein [Variibacter gotjawalensis]RZS50579.1 uncharacterized protein DUF955 [Variibacter gotjawalensis]BAT58413.1 hypothetical protein GJW-30_1_00938 [Variibacter gotjawalensis]
MKPIKEANRLTSIWRTAGPRAYPICLQDVVREIVNRSSDGDELQIEFRELDEFDGALVKTGQKTWCAIVNSRIASSGRRNFTLAHEIGHFIGHRHLAEEFRDTHEHMHQFGIEGLEAEANNFAAQLLMPQDEVRGFAVGEFTIHNLEALRNHLDVSWQAAGLRWVEVSDREVGFVVARDGMVNWGRASRKALENGIFFRSASETPENSPSLLATAGLKFRADHDRGEWHNLFRCKESGYRTLSHDFTSA